MKLLCSLLLLVLSFAFCAKSVTAQDEEPHNFTGTLVENASDYLKVSRVLQGKAEERTFRLNAQTKIAGGRLRAKERITVRYTSNDDGDTAILVIVRPAARKNK